MQTHSTAKISWWSSIKKLFTNPTFLLLFLFYGGCIGYTTAMSTKIEQILCAYGYSHQMSGLAGKFRIVANLAVIWSSLTTNENNILENNM